MKVKIDRENKAVFAFGNYKGKKIKAVAVCKEPEFDETFGVELVKRKFKIKKRFVQLRWHESEISRLTALRNNIDAIIKEHNLCANNIDLQIQNDICECENFVNEYFED